MLAEQTDNYTDREKALHDAALRFEKEVEKLREQVGLLEQDADKYDAEMGHFEMRIASFTPVLDIARDLIYMLDVGASEARIAAQHEKLREALRAHGDA